ARGINSRLLLEIEEARIQTVLHRWGNALAMVDRRLAVRRDHVVSSGGSIPGRADVFAVATARVAGIRSHQLTFGGEDEAEMIEMLVVVRLGDPLKKEPALFGRRQPPAAAEY